MKEASLFTENKTSYNDWKQELLELLNNSDLKYKTEYIDGLSKDLPIFISDWQNCTNTNDLINQLIKYETRH